MAEYKDGVQATCDEAIEHLSLAWHALVAAQIAASQAGDAELSKTISTIATLTSNVSLLCVTLPRLKDKG